jgi:hypothetical protein
MKKGTLKPDWKIEVNGPDADGLMWLVLSNEIGSVAFSAPITGVRGDLLLDAQLLTPEQV